ncbi:aminotransferase class I/II-fold pyridoxal phosphate-dependent enzyme [Propioniciclava coleopterorum]|uniref:Aminotransferase n=2 Tax=Propioniciclava coleopterorum TaxID=2714937 RepID=A0A6G7YAR1_9ACTN|nr:aminotransferase class I/II-fold pyridoxal phosphate-dependent enzyme [Propioniciclava coleopterorum]
MGGAATGALAAESRPDGARPRNEGARAWNDGARARNDGARAGVEPGSRTGYAPALGALPSWADALFVGNPTNPTGWLHARDDLLAAGRGRLLVVDEAFMDAADEAESLIEPTMPGRLVLRSLSKTWGLAGLRVGYIVGDPALIARLAAAQPPWPVSSPALAAMVAVSSQASRAEASERYRTVRRHRDHLVAALEASGFGVVAGHAPFVLVDTAELGPDSVRPALAARGFAVRRGESFPGLGRSWIRVRVPDPQISDAFVAALASLRASAPRVD